MSRMKKGYGVNDVLIAPGLCPDAIKTPHAACVRRIGEKDKLLL